MTPFATLQHASTARAQRADRVCEHGYHDCETCQARREHVYGLIQKMRNAQPNLAPLICDADTDGPTQYMMHVTMHGHAEASFTMSEAELEGLDENCLTTRWLRLAELALIEVSTDYGRASATRSLAVAEYNRKLRAERAATTQVRTRAPVDD